MGLKNAAKSLMPHKEPHRGTINYDNPRENIDPHVKTKVLAAKTISGQIIQGGVLYGDGSNLTGIAGGGGGSNWISGGGVIEPIDPSLIISGSNLLSRGVVDVGSQIRHLGDVNTLIGFQADHMTFTAGGRLMITLDEFTTDTIAIDTDNMSVDTSGNLDVIGTISGTFVYGDGSNLTNLPAAGGSQWVSGGGVITPIDSNLAISGATIRLGNGTISDPSMASIGDPDTGIYFGTGLPGKNIKMSVGGSQKFSLSINQLYLNNGGNYSNPGLALADGNTGIVGSGGDWGVSVNGVEHFRMNSGRVWFNRDQIDLDFSVSGDNDTNLLYTNGGTDRVGIGTASPSTKLDVVGTISGAIIIASSKGKMTSLGGFANLLTARENISGGKLVVADLSHDDSVLLAAAADVESFGVAEDDAISGANVWVICAGIADVMHDKNVAAVRGNWVATGAEIGTARTGASPAASPQHFEEVGHCIESVNAGGAGTNIKARCIINTL